MSDNLMTQPRSDNGQPSAGFGGHRHPGSDFAYGTTQSVGADTNMTMDRGDGSGLYHIASAVPSGNMPPPDFDPAMLSTNAVHPTQRGSSSSLAGTSSSPNSQPHRLSVGSNGTSFIPAATSSDTTSPGEGPTSGDMGMENMSQQQADDAAENNDEDVAGALPSWSELKTKAGKERKRLPLACIACRRKKIRCSGEKPACKHCLRSRIPCVYKVTTRKAAPRTDYMAMLDKRLKRMEERVIRIIPRDEQRSATSVSRAVLKPPLPAAPAKPGSVRKRGLEAAFSEELDEWAGRPPGQATRGTDATERGDRGPIDGQDADEFGLLADGADKLPPKEVQEHLAEIFFDYVYGQGYHLLHKPSFMRKLAQGTVPPVLMLAVCAISARFSNHPAVRTEPAFLRGEDWASVARDISLRRYDRPNITILIVYLILGLHEFGTCQGGRSWMFGGMAQRMAYALQLHTDMVPDVKSRQAVEKIELTPTDREIRRRTMWSCFLMDRFNSSGTDRPSFIDEQYILAQLPVRENYFQMEIAGPTEDLQGNVPRAANLDNELMSDATDNMGVAAYQIRIIAIWSKVVKYLNLGDKERDPHPMWVEESTFSSLRRAVQQWRETLPSSLEYSADNLQSHTTERIANQFLFLHITYNQVVLFLHRFALPMPGARSALPSTMPQAFIAESVQVACDAASQISALIHEAMDHRVVAPFAGYCAFFSSTVHIYGAFSGNPTLEASSKQNLARNVKFLTKMKKHWGMFHFVTENLRDLYRRHADAAKTGHGPSGSKDEPGIFQYGDWFDRYPRGVSETDYEEPSADVKKEPGADAVLGQKSDLQTVEEFFSKLAPPTRAAQLQQQQSHRKTAKIRRSRSESKPGVDSTPQRRPLAQGQGKQQMQPTLPESSHVLAGPQGFAQPPPGFPAGFGPPSLGSMMAQPPQFMSQLDRQMVLNSYAGLDAPASALASLQQGVGAMEQNPLLGQAGQQSLDQLNFGAFGNADMGNDVWGDPSTAWFMPFNMDPPAMAEDGNLFGGMYDWANLGGPGDLQSGNVDMGSGQVHGAGEARSTMDGVGMR